MPKLNKTDLKELEYVSMKDYFEKVEEYEDFNDKLEFTTHYLLRHGMKNADFSFEEAIHLARLKLNEASLDLKNKYFEQNNKKAPNGSINPFAKNEKDELKAKMFFLNPEGYLKGYAKKMSDEIFKKDRPTKPEVDFRDNLERLSNGFMIGGFINNSINHLDKNSNTPHVISRTIQRFTNKKNYDNALKNIKGGFFSRLFNTSSNEYKNFDRTFKAFNDPTNELYGDMNALETSMAAYVQLKIPGWKLGDPIAENTFRNLSYTERVRLNFFDKLLTSIESERKNQENLKEIIDNNKDLNIKLSDFEDVKKEQSQELFQDSLNKNLEDNKDINIINIENEIKENEIKENEISND